MMYIYGMYYVIEKGDEVVEFDKLKHKEFMFHTDTVDEKKLTATERILYNFFYTHACFVWNEEEHHPDHDVAIRVTCGDLAELLGLPEGEIIKAINKLFEYQLLGVVLIPNGTFAYHIVL